MAKTKKKNLTTEEKSNRKKQKAKKNTKQHLVLAKKSHQTGNDKQAIKDLSLGLKQFLKDKLDLTENDLNLKSILPQIPNDEIKSALENCWKTIEMYQFSPATHEGTEKLIEDTDTIINQIDKEL